ncbi:hypothetical protein HYC85_009110 [Camellia sinensis]|uniref:Uncharacterized protein n=1 Tax=Camellia sinensis TaxID=4442 RepID=A0A7J7HGZ4_CAMSI|nr:hypothetical protein HYC85_009110 [Camellia sinensis]
MECRSFELHQSLTGNGHTLTDNPHNFSLSKPWPILPSYLPWSLNPNVPFRSCESYFGNGFTHRIDLLKSSLSHHRTGGWFRCFYSETLRSSICEGGRVRMHPDKIRMSIGGERLEAVMGRGEDEELPVFESGAFDVEVVDRSSHGRKLVDDEFLNQYVQFGADSQHTMRGLVDSVNDFVTGISSFASELGIGVCDCRDGIEMGVRAVVAEQVFDEGDETSFVIVMGSSIVAMFLLQNLASNTVLYCICIARLCMVNWLGILL